ncbi:sulfite exporter TauE/SafE family protein [Rothia sp. ZJ932]|uniref:sulfite exporter TauE/SafE family protein n=1 Tax=Rothia sp. ZJ932 TaxID=2810516 RepID=UPI00196893CA|nr:sulfite exporter TauE/SafE family protein [Rothia sp. ZJ932]QRZ61476.1 sulfite exporter TauE/SafE family protein [Rothia sp. ZJ932]
MIEIFQLYPIYSWLLLALAAFLVGLSKTLLPGVNTISVAIFATTMPAKASTGALLLLLMLGDVMALLIYQHSAHWPTLIRMIPSVLIGLILGAAFLNFSQDTTVRRGVGWLLLFLMALTIWQRVTLGRSRKAPHTSNQKFIFAYGSLGGFSTMIANSGGPVMSMYFLAQRFEVKAFLGTTAWFFAVMNLLKLPFSMGLGLIDTQVLLVDAFLLPAVLAGGLVGWAGASAIKQKVFEWLIVGITLAGSAYLVAV